MDNRIETKPFIKKFKTRKGNCIYDVNSNDLLRVNKTVYDIIDDYDENKPDNLGRILENKKFTDAYGVEEIKENYDLIVKMRREKNYFSSNRPQISSRIDSPQVVHEALQSGLQQIVLEVSDRCNQRCRYCSFSGKYGYSRKHGTTHMTFDTAKKALDFFIPRSVEVSRTEGTAITYYGGEPLLNFQLLKQTVDYVVKTYKHIDPRFSFTTNGTLLDRKEVLDFLVENHIHILVSLDGPSHIHDRYRVFSNGKPTFQPLLNNLNRIRESYPAYFAEKISISAVLTPPFDFEAVSPFFFSSPFFHELRGRMTFGIVDPVDTTFFKDYGLEPEMKKLKAILGGLLEQYKAALIQGKYHELGVEKELFLRRFLNIATRKIYPMGEVFPPRGGCFPGRRKLFVDTGGNFYMCEKVRGNFKIGDVDNGFDDEAIYRYYREYDEFFSRCRACWALRLCNKCFNNIRRGESLDAKRREEFCFNMKETLEQDLIVFCEILEENPGAFSVFEKIGVV